MHIQSLNLVVLVLFSQNGSFSADKLWGNRIVFYYTAWHVLLKLPWF